MSPFLSSLLSTLGVWIPRVLAALLILLIGWIVAKIVAGIIRKLLAVIKLDNRLGKLMQGSQAPALRIEDLIATILYYVILFIAVLAALNVLGLTQITTLFSRMLDKLFAYLPNVAYAAVLVLVAWLVATVLRAIVVRVLSATGLDRRLGAKAGTQSTPPVSAAIGEAVYWLVWLLFLPVILTVLGFIGLLVPVQNMINELLAFLPNLLAAVIIVILGLFVARVVQRIVTSALQAFGADALSNRLGLGNVLGKPNLSGLLGYIVYVLIIIPVVIAALNALNLQYLAQPISEMLNKALAWLPNIFAAILLLAVAYLIGRVLADVVATLLRNAGFDKILARLGVGQSGEDGQTSLSQVVGYLILVAIMLVAAQIAAGMLGWSELVGLINTLIAFLARVALAVVVLAIGIFLSNLAAKVILTTNLEEKRLLALLARVAIVAFAAAMALEQTGIASNIINLGFGLILAGVALALALAFGLGGRDVAKYQLVRWYKSVESELEEKKE